MGAQHLRAVSGGKTKPPPTGIDVRARLRDYESLAWDTYLKIARGLTIPRVRSTADGYLEIRAIPSCTRIGLEGTLAEEMFGLASEAWAALETAPGKVVRLNPGMQRDIDDVRHGIRVRAERRSTVRTRLDLLTPEQLHEHFQAAMDPANLYLLPGEISTPWIILPRAYSSMRREHIHYLPAYLEVVDTESNAEVLHIFTRIVIEFLANFTIRFAEKRFPRDQVVCLLTAGYLALFCRNLLAPPVGLDEPHVADHFLSWLKHSHFRDGAVQSMQLPDTDTLALLQ